MSAVFRVFGIPEPLERILDQLPLPSLDSRELADPQLFVLQRVNHAFRDTISESPRLRKRMLELEPNPYSIFWLHTVPSCQNVLRKAVRGERTLTIMQYEKSKVVHAWRKACRSDTSSAHCGSWKQIKILRDTAERPVVAAKRNSRRSKSVFAFAEPGTTLGELLDADWVDYPPIELLSRTTRGGQKLELLEE
ncbi:hypothetical protein HII31_02409 [Pseudocercospora fuligena]|uniref:F-box domain-containing protein n=1 Tax=Pseudocercospora fuligena TaxID=685502 RepID=A0A8H6RT26_9PEZI|nr:hypothetical protein HII31_02409 [Pseudocercospora fuligena]